jgi:glycosyltransferase involved in cell wall biosynthesis
MKETRICHITTVHPRKDVRIFHKQCCSLANHFDDVSLIVADGANDELSGGVQIYDIGKIQGRVKRFLQSGKMALQKALEVNADLYHLHDPELLRIALKLKEYGKIVIYDSHEDVPRQILNKPYIPKVFRPLVSAIFEKHENKIVKKLSGIVTATPYIKDRFLKINPNLIDINNFPIIDNIHFNDHWEDRCRSIGYIGGIFKTRGIMETLEAINGTDIKFSLAGKFVPDSLENDCKNHEAWRNVKFIGYINRDEINEFLGKIRLGFVILEATPSYVVSLPVKMFEYMAAGIPFIASDFKYWRDTVEQDKCCFFVDEKNPEDIRKLLESIIDNIELLKEYGANGRKAVEEKYNWNIEKEKLFNFYKKIITKSK